MISLICHPNLKVQHKKAPVLPLSSKIPPHTHPGRIDGAERSQCSLARTLAQARTVSRVYDARVLMTTAGPGGATHAAQAGR